MIMFVKSLGRANEWAKLSAPLSALSSHSSAGACSCWRQTIASSLPQWFWIMQVSKIWRQWNSVRICRKTKTYLARFCDLKGGWLLLVVVPSHIAASWTNAFWVDEIFQRSSDCMWWQWQSSVKWDSLSQAFQITRVFWRQPFHQSILFCQHFVAWFVTAVVEITSGANCS